MPRTSFIRRSALSLMVTPPRLWTSTDGRTDRSRGPGRQQVHLYRALPAMKSDLSLSISPSLFLPVQA